MVAKIIGGALLAALLLTGPAQADPLDDALAAYQAGDVAKAIEIWRAAAAEGDPEAQNNLGLVYAEGEGVAKDAEEARRWFLLAAAKGYAPAETELGSWHLRAGEYARAAEWLEKAAAKGELEGRLVLGRLLAQGAEGVAADPVRAFALVYSVAMAEGGGQALKGIAVETIARMENSLPPAILAAAKEAAMRGDLRPAAERAAARPAGKAFTPHAWLARRQAFQQAWRRHRDSGGTDAAARATIAETAAQFDQSPLSVTPLEAMAIYAVAHQPKSEADMPEVFRDVAFLATLGWYDALRFGDVSARSEILHNEAFFKLVLALGGEASIDRATAFMRDHRKEAADAVARGIAMAAKARDVIDYDERWPASLGVYRFGCAAGQDCEAPPALPPDKWDEAFVEAAATVELYYRIND